jgi:uncharacterized protein (DUF2141 family)
VWVGLLVAWPLAASADAGAGAMTLTVRASGFRNGEGQALVALYGSAEAWLKLPRALRVTALPIKDGAIEVQFAGLPAGDYAVTVIHDENRNGKMDVRWFPWPKPKEGSALSNGAKGHVGPPKWADARFPLAADRTLAVTVSY